MPENSASLSFFSPEHTATVVGTGAIGRQVALYLTALGIQKLRLVDDAVVAGDDVTSCGFKASDVGRPRADATLGACFELEPHQLHGESITESLPAPTLGSLFYCDGDAERLVIIDPATSAGFVGAAWTAERFVHIFADASGGLPQVTARSSASVPLYVAGLAAALMIQQFVRYLSGRPIEQFAVLDLENGTYVSRPVRD